MICDLAFLRLETLQPTLIETHRLVFFWRPQGRKTWIFFMHLLSRELRLLRLWHYLWTSPIVTQHVQKAHRFFCLNCPNYFFHYRVLHQDMTPFCRFSSFQKNVKKVGNLTLDCLVHSVGKSHKMSHLSFSILSLSTNFCPIKIDLSGNTVWLFSKIR